MGRLIEWLPLALLGLVPLYAAGTHVAVGRRRSAASAVGAAYALAVALAVALLYVVALGVVSARTPVG